ncbi:hypothetical protein AArcSl_2617 [Halalkaliarchaeum desulfuricum]|uniref:Uncharacterized protein n=1 Tax=Halalkaliarchaeum desulfuricum TaxID=2055893 RepID=A0A343TMB4_9EURY|nr:hypothetical protein [Halalkaliarchaeum desulfuricum]AUX10236.1 hypothetical protein AArcSl_2617 [Halalkaliarchaeum desulfuricum]
MIVVATEDFELYHEAVSALRDRGTTFTTVQPGEPLPEGTTVVLTGPDDDLSPVDLAGPGDRPSPPEIVRVDPGNVRRGIEEALSILRGGAGRTVIGIDSGPRPGVAVLSGKTVTAAFSVPIDEVVDLVADELSDVADPLVRVGDGDRLKSARIVNELAELEGVEVELVDETGTTPALGAGARGGSDVLAAVNIALRPGEPVSGREIEPTPGELERIKTTSRERSAGDRTIDEELARRVADGELTIDEALQLHRERDGSGP